jgi:hypothetical protein
MCVRISNESSNARDSRKFKVRLPARRSTVLRRRCIEFRADFPWTWWTQRDVTSQWGFMGTLHRSALSCHKHHKYSGGSPATSVRGKGIYRLVSQQGIELGWSCLKGTQDRVQGSQSTATLQSPTDWWAPPRDQGADSRTEKAQSKPPLLLDPTVPPPSTADAQPPSHHFPLLTHPGDLPMFLKSDFTKLLELCSLRNVSSLW